MEERFSTYLSTESNVSLFRVVSKLELMRNLALCLSNLLRSAFKQPGVALRRFTY